MTQDTLPDVFEPRKTAPVVKQTPVKKRKKNVFEGFGEPYNHARGETSLWVAVITQAMMDATNRAKSSEAQYHKHEAIHWLTQNSQNFILVCLFAGFDPDYIRRKAKRALAAGLLWRAEAGKGKRYHERKKYRERIKAERKQKKNRETPEIHQVIVGPWSAKHTDSSH